MNSATARHVIFLATSRSGLGHIRRVASIAGAIRATSAGVRVGLFTNAPLAGLTRHDMNAFTTTLTIDRADMAAAALHCGADAIVADTMVPEGLDMVTVPRILILRETPHDRLPRLWLPGAQRWDLVLVPNPAAHWMPEASEAFSRRVTATGWIYRTPRSKGPPQRKRPLVLIATGGGGTPETASLLAQQADDVITRTRHLSPHPFEVVQALGPRASTGATISTADRIIDPGGELNEHFAEADAVISTAGYNSVLELAMTTTPTLLMAIPRTYDNQAERAESWGPRLGMNYQNAGSAAAWLTKTLQSRQRRPAVDIGASGSHVAARCILDLLP